MQMHQKLTADVTSPRKLNRHVPADMATICLKCLESDPNRRYPTAGFLAQELRRFLRGEPIQARPVSAPARVWRWSKRNPALAAAILLTVFLAVAGPLAALQLASQNKTIQTQLDERNRLIYEYQAERDEQAQRIADLEMQHAEMTAGTRLEVRVHHRFS
jgi:hypothetical protein